MRKDIQPGEEIYATGVFLERNPNIPGGWEVKRFEDDSFYDDYPVEQDEKGYFIDVYEKGEDDEC